MNSELKSGLRESMFKRQATVNVKVTLALKTLGDYLSLSLEPRRDCYSKLATLPWQVRTEEMEIQVETHVENQELHFNCEVVSVGKS